MKKGMTLVEILVSLLILAFVLGAVFTILNLQIIKTTQVQKTSILQTDAQVALSLLKWDMGAAGLGYPKLDNVVTSGDGLGPGGTDAITLRAVGFGFEAGKTRWSWLLDKTNSTTALVRWWDDTAQNFQPGDLVVVLNRNREIMTPPGYITVLATQPDTFYDPHGTPIPAQKLTLDQQLSTIAGLVMICIDTLLYNPGITYQVVNNQLMRGNDILLDNVEDLQFAYGLDNDGDNVIETWTDNLPAQYVSLGRKWAIRYNLVVTSRPMRGYQYHAASYTVENHVVNIPNGSPQQRQRRAFLSGIIAPPNLQP